MPRLLALLLTLVLLAAIGGPAHAQYLLFEIPSPSGASDFGSALALVPDVDGDGLDDLVVGAPMGVVDGDASAGRVYVFSLATETLIHDLVSPLAQGGGRFGTAVAGLDDVDGDGRGDVLVGACGESGDGSPGAAGRAHVLSGATGSVLYTLVSASEEEGGEFGCAVSRVLDADGDGLDDVLVGAPQEDGGGRNSAGQAHLFSGADGAWIRTLVSSYPRPRGHFGEALAGVADVNGDGRGDMVVGAPDEGFGTSSATGSDYMFSGADGGLIYEHFDAGGRLARYGAGVAGLSDLTGDGRPEYVVGEPFGSSGTGAVTVRNGATGQQLFYSSPFDLSFISDFGLAVAGIGDADEDGTDDLAVGAPGGSRYMAFVLSGVTGDELYSLEDPIQPRLFGQAVLGLPDLDADGTGDLAVGASNRVLVYSAGIEPLPPLVSARSDPPAVVVPAEGGTFDVVVTLTSQNVGLSVEWDVWGAVVDPDGEVEEPAFGPIAVELGPQETVTLTQPDTVAASAPSGAYTYHVYVGTYPSEVVASDSFAFTKAMGTAAEPDALPAVLVLHEARPNPFATRTTISFELPEATPVRLSVYDVLGRAVAVVVDAERAAGRHEAVLDGARLPAGTYLVRLEAGAFVQTGRVSVVR